MESYTYVIVGGGLAGAEAAKAIRNIDSENSILIVGSEPVRPYNRPPLSKEFLQGRKPENEIFVDVESAYKKNKIQLLLGKTVSSIDPEAHTAQIGEGESIGYKKLLLATGGTPFLPDIPGAKLPGVHTLRTLEDAKTILESTGPGKTVVLVGGGFIGVEAAASLTQRKVSVTVLERGPAVMPEIAEEHSSRYIRNYCEMKGVQFRVNANVTAIEGSDRAEAVVTEDGTRHPCDVIIVAVGIRPNVDLARAAGLELEAKGVRVDARMRTSHPDIYAAGDIASFPDPWFHTRRRAEHWGQAEYTGQLAGKNMAGKDESYDLVTYVWSDVFDLHLEFAGWTREADTTRLRGKPGDGSFIVLYLKENALKAYLAVNAPKEEYGPLEGLIKSGADLSGRLDELTQRGKDVAKLVESIA